jgi:hypothetical protein
MQLSLLRTSATLILMTTLLTACIGSGNGGDLNSDKQGDKDPRLEIPTIPITGHITRENGRLVAQSGRELAMFHDKMMRSGFIALGTRASDSDIFIQAYINNNRIVDRVFECDSGLIIIKGDAGTTENPGSLTLDYNDCATEDGWYIDGKIEVNLLAINANKDRLNALSAVINNLSVQYPEFEHDYALSGDLRIVYAETIIGEDGTVEGATPILQAFSNDFIVKDRSVTRTITAKYMSILYFGNRAKLAALIRKGYFLINGDGYYGFNENYGDDLDPNSLFLVGGNGEFNRLSVRSDYTSDAQGENPLVIGIVIENDLQPEYFIRLPADQLGKTYDNINSPSISTPDDVYTKATKKKRIPTPAFYDLDYDPMSLTLSIEPPASAPLTPVPLITRGSFAQGRLFNVTAQNAGEYTATFTVSDGTFQDSASFKIIVEPVE